MCYLKKFETIQAVPATKTPFSEETSFFNFDQPNFIDFAKDDIFGANLAKKQYKFQPKNGLILGLLSRMNENSLVMHALNEDVDRNIQLLDQICENYKNNEQSSGEESTIKIEEFESFTNQETPHQESIACQPLVTGMFGKKDYKYKIELKTPLEQTIYKERNISFELQLVNSEGTVVRNSNMINLCLGVCDNKGEWIAQTRSGDNFIKGKSETELYHGECGFSKIYPRDVSRGYLDGKVNFVVYPKPSMLHYSEGDNSMERKINHEEIQPLLIKDLSIKAKRKN